MRVLMLTCNNSLQDGINRHILAMAPAVNGRDGCEAAVCTTFASGELNAALDRVGVKCYALGLSHGHDIRNWWRLWKVMRDFKPDVIHAHVLGLFSRWFLDCFYPRLPIVSTCHGITDVESGVRKVEARDRLDAVIGRFRLPRRRRVRPTRTIYISEGVRDFRGGGDSPVIYNPVKFDFLAGGKERMGGIRRELELPTDTPLIGTACRIAPQKCPHVFVEVMCSVLRRETKAHAVICGTTQNEALLARLKQRIAGYGLESRFHWLGYRTDAPEITKELDCFVMTSATEGMPTALLEAMAVKTPIAFMRGKGGLVDLDRMNREEGPIALVSDVGDVDGLAMQIVKILQDPSGARNMADFAFECGARHFSLELAAEQLVNVYKDILIQSQEGGGR